VTLSYINKALTSLPRRSMIVLQTARAEPPGLVAALPRQCRNIRTAYAIQHDLNERRRLWRSRSISQFIGHFTCPRARAFAAGRCHILRTPVSALPDFSMHGGLKADAVFLTFRCPMPLAECRWACRNLRARSGERRQHRRSTRHLATAALAISSRSDQENAPDADAIGN
jgi:hypothetical protein